MLKGLRSFFGTPVGKVGAAAIKVWHLALVAVVGTAAAAGTVVYVRSTTTPVAQHVVVFLSGLNSSMTANC
jgi:hypothetical protein